MYDESAPELRPDALTRNSETETNLGSPSARTPSAQLNRRVFKTSRLVLLAEGIDASDWPSGRRVAAGRDANPSRLGTSCPSIS
jgi:hypothetical protein